MGALDKQSRSIVAYQTEKDGVLELRRFKLIGDIEDPDPDITGLDILKSHIGR
jgi:hypothetical protein